VRWKLSDKGAAGGHSPGGRSQRACGIDGRVAEHLGMGVGAFVILVLIARRCSARSSIAKPIRKIARNPARTRWRQQAGRCPLCRPRDEIGDAANAANIFKRI